MTTLMYDFNDTKQVNDNNGVIWSTLDERGQEFICDCDWDEDYLKHECKYENEGDVKVCHHYLKVGETKVLRAMLRTKYKNEHYNSKYGINVYYYSNGVEAININYTDDERVVSIVTRYRNGNVRSEYKLNDNGTITGNKVRSNNSDIDFKFSSKEQCNPENGEKNGMSIKYILRTGRILITDTYSKINDDKTEITCEEIVDTYDDEYRLLSRTIMSGVDKQQILYYPTSNDNDVIERINILHHRDFVYGYTKRDCNNNILTQIMCYNDEVVGKKVKTKTGNHSSNISGDNMIEYTLVLKRYRENKIGQPLEHDDDESIEMFKLNTNFDMKDYCEDDNYDDDIDDKVEILKTYYVDYSGEMGPDMGKVQQRYNDEGKITLDESYEPDHHLSSIAEYDYENNIVRWSSYSRGMAMGSGKSVIDEPSKQEEPKPKPKIRTIEYEPHKYDYMDYM